jgi:hypothetical protein
MYFVRAATFYLRERLAEARASTQQKEQKGRLKGLNFSAMDRATRRGCMARDGLRLPN